MPDESDKDTPQQPLSATEKAFMRSAQTDPEMQAERKTREQQREVLHSSLVKARSIEEPLERAEALISGAASLYGMTRGGNRQDRTDALQAFNQGLRALEETREKDEPQRQITELTSIIISSGIDGEERGIVLGGITENSIRDSVNLEFIRVNLDSPINFRAAAAQRLLDLYRQSHPHLVDKLFEQRSKSAARGDPFTAARQSEQISEILTQHRTLEGIAQPLLEQGKLFEAALVFQHSHHGPLRTTALREIALELAEGGQVDHALGVVQFLDNDWSKRRVAEQVASHLVQAGHIDKGLAAANTILDSVGNYNDGSTQIRNIMYNTMIETLIDAGKLDEAEKAAQTIMSNFSREVNLAKVRKARESQK